MKKSTDATKTLFPTKEIRFGEAETDVVSISPLPMSKLPDAIGVFAGIFEELYKDGSLDEDFSPAAMARAGAKLFKDILALLPICIDRPLEDIPTSATPELIRTFIHQNVMDVGGNWQALADDLGLSGLYQRVATQKQGGGQS